MKKIFKKAISSVLAASLIFSSFGMNFVEAAASDFSAVGGWYETLFAELNVDESTIASVSYSKNGGAEKSLTGDDFEYLVRENGTNKTRIDIPGLEAGNYSLNVKLKNGTAYSASDLVVYENDRTGYAHKDASIAGLSGVGAYKNDGTIKDNAVIVYVTEDNKNTVTVPGLSNSPVGIGNILNYKSEDTGSTTGSGKADALKELAAAGKALDIRIIGSVIAGDSNTRSDVPSENVLGLTQYNGTGNGGTAKDNGMVARMFNAQNITIEGIGTDATIDGWGFQVIAGTARPSQSVEFRNLSFKTTPEDAIGLEGTVNKSKDPQDKAYLDQYSPIKYCWVHNCTFYPGYCKNPAESDKAEGDGSLDFKRGYGFTQDYNHYIENHKTNLIGSSSDSIQYDITYHHNFYDQVWSRQPLVRQANVHIFNSYFKNGSGTSYIISPRAHSYTLSEANYYENCKNPVDSPSEGGGYVKSFNDNFAACTGNNYATVVTSRETPVDGVDNKLKADFDTAGKFPYDYTPTDAVQAKADCLAKAGVMKPAGEINMDPEKISVLSEYPSAAIKLPYTLDCTQAYPAGKSVIDNAILNAASKGTGTSVKIRDNGVIFAVTQSATVSFTAGSSSKYGMVLMDQYGVVKGSIASSGSTSITVEPGIYVLKSGNIDKDAYLESFKVVAAGQGQTVEYTTQPTTEGTTSKVTEATEATTKKTETPTETTTQNENSEITGDGYIWNGTTGENTDNFFYIEGNDWTGQTITYKGAALNRAIKMESDTDIHFNVAGAGTLYVYTYSTKDQPTIEINDGTENVSPNGINKFDISYSQPVYITKGTTSTYIYFMQFIPRAEEIPGETTTQATTVITTEATTEATTQKQETPAGSVNISASKVNAAVGSKASVPVKATNNAKNIGGYIIALNYDSALKYSGVTDKTGSTGQLVDYSSGNTVVLAYVGSAPAGSTLFEAELTATKTGEFPVTVLVQEIIDIDEAHLTSSTTNGSVTAAYAASGSGDVYKDGVINDLDAAYLLKYISGEDISGIANIDLNEANCDGSASTVPDMLDVVWILNHKTVQTETESSTETTTLDLGDAKFIESWEIDKNSSVPEWLNGSDLKIVDNGSSYTAFVTTLNRSSNFPKAVSIPAGEVAFNVSGKQTIKLYLASDHNDDGKSKASFTFTDESGSTTLKTDAALPSRKNTTGEPVEITVTGKGIVTMDVTYTTRLYKVVIS